MHLCNAVFCQFMAGRKVLLVSSLYLLTMLSVGQSSFAVERQGLFDIYTEAMTQDPVLSGARHARGVIKENLSLAWSKLRPELSVSYDYTDTTQTILSSDNEVFDQGESEFTTTEYALTLRQPILRVDAVKGVGLAKLEQLRADLDLEAANQDLIVRVAERYLLALSAQDQLAFAQAEQAAVEKHFELADARFEIGLAPITDLHDARARLASRKAQTLAAETQLVDALEALQELTGTAPESLVPLVTSFEPVLPMPDNVDEWIAAANSESLAVKAQVKLVEMARRVVSIQKAGHYPTLDLIGRFNNQATEGSLFGGGSEVETTDFSLQFNLPLYQGHATVAKTRQALEQQKQAQADLEKIVRETQRLARSSFLGVKTAITRIEALAQAVLSQRSALEAKQEGYRSGLFTSLAVLDAERDLYLAMNEVAQARYDYILNNLKLRQAVGSLGEADLKMADKWFIEQPQTAKE